MNTPSIQDDSTLQQINNLTKNYGYIEAKLDEVLNLLIVQQNKFEKKQKKIFTGTFFISLMRVMIVALFAEIATLLLELLKILH